eukprot:771285-Pelagomonas_calceolata.AAC.3
MSRGQVRPWAKHSESLLFCSLTRGGQHGPPRAPPSLELSLHAKQIMLGSPAMLGEQVRPWAERPGISETRHTCQTKTCIGESKFEWRCSGQSCWEPYGSLMMLVAMKKLTSLGDPSQPPYAHDTASNGTAHTASSC